MRRTASLLLSIACWLPMQQVLAWEPPVSEIDRPVLENTVIRPASDPIWIDSKAVQAAIKEAASADKFTVGREVGRLKNDPYEVFARRMADAKIPGCLNSDGLKFQPTFIFAGLLALPFIPIAAARGKCKLAG